MRARELKKEYFKDKPELDFRYSVCSLIAEIRYKKGWTQKKMAKHLGMHQEQISMYESFSRMPSLKMLYKIADKCGYNLSFNLINK